MRTLVVFKVIVCVASLCSCFGGAVLLTKCDAQWNEIYLIASTAVFFQAVVGLITSDRQGLACMSVISFTFLVVGTLLYGTEGVDVCDKMIYGSCLLWLWLMEWASFISSCLMILL